MKMVEEYICNGRLEQRIVAENISEGSVNHIANEWYKITRVKLAWTGRNLENWSVEYPGQLINSFGRVVNFDGEGENYSLYVRPDEYEIWTSSEEI